MNVTHSPSRSDIEASKLRFVVTHRPSISFHGTKPLALLLAIFALIVIAQAQGPGQERLFSSAKQVVLQKDNLIWLDDSRGAIYRISTSPKGEFSSRDPFRRIEGHAELLWVAETSTKPAQIAADDSYIYVADGASNSVLQLSTEGKLLKRISSDLMKQPSGIAVLGPLLFVSDIGADKILVIDITSGRILGSTSFRPGSTPSKLRFSGHQLFGMDFSQEKVFRLTPDLALLATNPAEGIPDQLTTPFVQRQELDLKEQVGNLADFDVSNDVLYCVDYEKRALFLFPLEGTAPTSLKYSSYAQAPSALTVDNKHIYLADPTTGSFVEIPLVVPATLFFEGIDAQRNYITFLGLLRESGFLPTREFVVRPGDFWEKSVTDPGFLSDTFRKSYKQFVCDINKNVCNNQSTNQEQIFQIPNLNVKPYYASLPVTLPFQKNPANSTSNNAQQPQTLEEVARMFVTNEITRPELDKLLLERNKTYDGSDILSERTGYFLVPTRAFSAQGAFPLSLLSERKNHITNDFWSQTTISLPHSVQPQSIRTTQEVNRSIALPSVQSFEVCRDLAPDFCHVLKLVDYYLPDKARPAQVVVVDINFDPRHPAFKGDENQVALSVYNVPGRPPSKYDDSDKVRETFNPISDHGNHVSALIGGRARKDEMQGIHPNALIYGLALGDFKTAIEVDETSELRGLRLFNLSIGESDAEPGQFDAVKAHMLAHPDELFVIAAGNESGGIAPEAVASKGALDNVIVVGATDTNGDAPGLMAGSNYNANIVSVMAPGRNILSALAGNNLNYGPTSGTSQACAIVTGAAAILMGLQPTWDPWRIKQRIVMTANLKNWADGNQSDKVLAGMIDIRRAVDDRDNVVVLIKKNLSVETGAAGGGIELTEVKGLIPDNFFNTKKIVVKTEDPEEPEIPITYSHLLRVRRSEIDKNKFIILFSVPDEIPVGTSQRKSHKIRRIIVDGANIRGDRIFPIFPNNGSPGANHRIEYDLREIDDFINR